MQKKGPRLSGGLFLLIIFSNRRQALGFERSPKDLYNHNKMIKTNHAHRRDTNRKSQILPRILRTAPTTHATDNSFESMPLTLGSLQLHCALSKEAEFQPVKCKSHEGHVIVFKPLLQLLAHIKKTKKSALKNKFSELVKVV